MSATSRRTFLSGAAAATAGYAAVFGPAAAQSHGPTPNAISDTHAPPDSIQPPIKDPSTGASGLNVDYRFAREFIIHPRFLDPALDNRPNSAVLLYGLVCVDFDDDFQELLLPNTEGAEAKKAEVQEHVARLWCAQEIVTGTPDKSFPVTGEPTIAFWDLKGKTLTIEALNASGAVIAAASPDLKWRNSMLHPWTNQRSVRCIKDLIKNGMIEEDKRIDSKLVASRVKLTKGTITAIPPFSALGRDVEWKVKKADGTDALHATTDAMVWQREYSSAVTSFRFRLRPLAGGEERLITIKPNTTPRQPPLVAAVSHAMPMSGMTGLKKLTDTRAFAQLVKGGVMKDYPTAEANRNAPPQLVASGSDGHCECACA